MEIFDLDKWCHFVDLLTDGKMDSRSDPDFQKMKNFLEDDAQPYQNEMNSLLADTLNSDGGFEKIQKFLSHLCDKLTADSKEKLKTEKFYAMILTGCTLADVNLTNTGVDKEAFVKRQMKLFIHKLQLIHQCVKTPILRLFSLESLLFHCVAEKILVWKDVFYNKNWKDIEMALVNCLSPYLNLQHVDTIMKLHVQMELTLSAEIFGTETYETWQKVQTHFLTVQEIRKKLTYDSSALGYEILIESLQKFIKKLEYPGEGTSVEKGTYSIISIIKDLKQLQRIDDYIQLALNLKESELELFGINFVERAFQVIGESLKCSDKSPTFTTRKLFHLKKAGIEIDLLNSLRDCLSHGNSLLFKQRDYNIPNVNSCIVTDLLNSLRKMNTVLLKLRYQLQMEKFKYQLLYILPEIPAQQASCSKAKVENNKPEITDQHAPGSKTKITEIEKQLADTHTFKDLLRIIDIHRCESTIPSMNLVNLENEINLGNQIHETKRGYAELLEKIEHKTNHTFPNDRVVPTDDGKYLTPDQLNEKMATKKSKSEITAISSTAMKAVSKMTTHLTMAEPMAGQINQIDDNDNFVRDFEFEAKQVASFKADETILLQCFEYEKTLIPIQLDCIKLLRKIDDLKKVRMLRSDIEKAGEQCQNEEPIWMADRMKQFTTKLTTLSGEIFQIPATTETWTKIQFMKKCEEFLQLRLFEKDIYQSLIKILQSLVEYTLDTSDINISEICKVDLQLEPRVEKLFNECLHRLCYKYNHDKAVIDLVYKVVNASSVSAEDKIFIHQNFKKHIQYHNARIKLLNFFEAQLKKGKQKKGNKKKDKKVTKEKDGKEKDVQTATLSKCEYDKCAELLGVTLPKYSDYESDTKLLLPTKRKIEVSVQKKASEQPETAQYTHFLKTAKSSRGVFKLCESFEGFVSMLCSNDQKLRDSVLEAFKHNEFNKLCDFYLKRLTKLKQLDSQWDIRSSFQRNLKLRAAVETILLDMTDTWKQLCENCGITWNERIFRLLLGHIQNRLKMSVRNYLAHGDVVLESSNLYCIGDGVLVEAAQAYLQNGQMLLNLLRLWNVDEIKTKLIDAVGQTIIQIILPIEFESYREALTELLTCEHYMGWVQNLSMPDTVQALDTHWNEQSVINTKFLLAEELIFRIKFRLVSVDLAKNLFKVFGYHATVAAFDYTTSGGWTLALTIVNLSYVDSYLTKDLIEFLIKEHRLNITSVLDESGATVLHLAVIHKNLNLTNAIIDMDGDSLNKRTHAGCTALSLACQRNYYEICDLLLHQPEVEINKGNAFGWAPVHFAVSFSTECLHLLLRSRKFHVNVPGPDGSTALFMAIENRDLKLSEILIRAGADINMFLLGHHGLGRNCFHYAACVSSTEILKLLVDYGAQPHAFTYFKRRIDKRNALHLATIYGALDNVKYLIDECGLDIHLKDQEGHSPFELSILSEQKPITEYFLSKFGNVLSTSSESIQLQIYDALLQGDLTQLEKFHDLGLNVSSRVSPIAAVPNAILMPVCAAASKGHKEILMFLCSIGADMESAWDGFKAIHFAIMKGHLDVVLYLVNQVDKKQCQLRTTGEYALNAIEMAASCGQLRITQLLQTYYSKKEQMLALLVAAKNKEWAFINSIIDDNLDELRDNIDTEDENKRRLIHVATEYRQWSLIQKLIESGADYNVIDPKTKLLPILQNSLKAVEYIIEELHFNISDISWKTECGSTMVHFLAAHGSGRVLELINCEKVNLFCMDFEQNSTLHYACKNRNSETIWYLLKKSPSDNLNQKNIRGYTPFHQYLMAGLSINTEADFLLFKQHGCNFHLLSEKNENIFHILGQSSRSSPVDIFGILSQEFSHESYLELLNSLNTDGWSPLAVALQNNSTMVKPYLDRGASPSMIHLQNGKSILQCAAESNNHTSFDLVLKALVSKEVIFKKCLNAMDSENKDTILGVCAKRRNENMLKLLLKYSPLFDIDYQNKYGNTALHQVVRHGHFDLLYILLQHKPNPNVVNNNNLTPIQEVAKLPNNENTDKIKKMLQIYVDDFKRDAEEDTIARNTINQPILHNQQCNSVRGEELLAATNEGSIDKVKGLLADEAMNRTFMEYRNVNGETALFIATRSGFEKIVRMLLEKGSDVNSHNGIEYWCTPLLMAVKCSRWNIANLLLDAGATVSDVGMKQNLFYVVCQQSDGVDFLRRLVEEYSIDVNSTVHFDRFEHTLLNVAIRHKNFEIVSFLLKNRADVGSKDWDGNTALHELALIDKLEESEFHNAVDIIQLCKKKLFDNPMIKFNNKKETALHLACISGNPKIVLALLTLIPEFADIRDANENLPFHQAIKRGESINILDMFLHLNGNMMNEWHGDMLPIHLAAANGKIDIIEGLMSREKTASANVLLLQKGRSIYSKFTAVDFAVHEGQLGTVQWFIEEAGVKANPAMIPIAIEQSNWDIAKYLLQFKECGVDCDVGPTSLILAAAHNELEIVKSLLEKPIGKKHINSICKNGENALIKSIGNNNYEMVELLLKSGGNFYTVVFDSHDTCLHIAANNNFIQIAKLLLQYHPHGNDFKNRLGFTPSGLAESKCYKEMKKVLTSKEN